MYFHTFCLSRVALQLDRYIHKVLRAHPGTGGTTVPPVPVAWSTTTLDLKNETRASKKKGLTHVGFSGRIIVAVVPPLPSQDDPLPS